MSERGFQTRAIHGASLPPVDQQTPSVPLYQTSTFRFPDADAYADTIAFQAPGYTYTRGYGNPTLTRCTAAPSRSRRPSCHGSA